MVKRTTRVLVVSVVLLSGAVAGPREVEATHTGCHPPRDASVVRSGSRLVMWLRTDKGVFACHRRTARTSRLLGEYDKDGYWWRPQRYATNADMAGLVARYTDKYGSNDLQIRVRNARRGALRQVSTGHSSQDAMVTGFVLSRFGGGAVAYSLPGERTRIEAFRPGREGGLHIATLDADADPSGLRLVTQSQVEWTSHGARRRASLPD